MLLVQLVPCALALALDKTGKSMAARMAIIAITTNSSIKVKPCAFALEAGWQPGSRLMVPDNGFHLNMNCSIVSTAPAKNNLKNEKNRPCLPFSGKTRQAAAFVQTFNLIYMSAGSQKGTKNSPFSRHIPLS
jgi:hypothetical protein